MMLEVLVKPCHTRHPLTAPIGPPRTSADQAWVLAFCRPSTVPTAERSTGACWPRSSLGLALTGSSFGDG